MHLLVIGWKAFVEKALEAMDVPHTTVVSLADFARLRDQIGQERLIACGDWRDVEGVLAALGRAGVTADDFDAVLGSNEFALVTASVLAQLFGKSTHLPVDVALRFRDKALQKRAVARAGIPVARVAEVRDRVDLESAEVAALGFPLVIKPFAGAGAALTYQIDDVSELRARYAEMAGFPFGPFIVEEFVPGREMHVDGRMHRGELAFFSVSSYTQFKVFDVHSGSVDGTYALDPLRHKDYYDTLGPFALRSLRALGMDDGVFHMEVFESPDGFHFSECAARPGGSGVMEVFELKFGVSLPQEDARAAMGLPPGAPVVSPQAFGATMLFAPAGRVVAVPTLDELLAQPGVVDGELQLSVGGRMPDMTKDTMTRPAHALVTGDDESRVLERIDALRKWFTSATIIEPD